MIHLFACAHGRFRLAPVHFRQRWQSSLLPHPALTQHSGWRAMSDSTSPSGRGVEGAPPPPAAAGGVPDGGEHLQSHQRPAGVSEEEYLQLRGLGLLAATDIGPAPLTEAQLVAMSDGAPLPSVATCGPGGRAVWAALIEGMLGSDRQLAELNAAAPLSTLLAESARTMRHQPPRPLREEETGPCAATVPAGVYRSESVRYGGFLPSRRPAAAAVPAAARAAALAARHVRPVVISEFARITDEEVRRSPHTLFVVSCPAELLYTILHEGTDQESVVSVEARPPPEQVLHDAAEGTDAHLLRALAVPLPELATVERAVPSLRVLPVPEAEQRRAAEQGYGLVRYPNVMPVYAASAGALRAGRDSSPGATQHADWPASQLIRGTAMSTDISTLPRELMRQLEAIRSALSTGAYTSIVVREVYGPLTVSEEGVADRQPRNQFGVLSSVTPEIISIAEESPPLPTSPSPEYTHVQAAMMVVEGKSLSRPEQASAAARPEQASAAGDAELGAGDVPAAVSAHSDENLDDGDGGRVAARRMDETLVSTAAASDAAAPAPRNPEGGGAEAAVPRDAAGADTKDADGSSSPLPAEAEGAAVVPDGPPPQQPDALHDDGARKAPVSTRELLFRRLAEERK